MHPDDELTFDVFLSHNSKNKPAVRELKRLLLEKKLIVWLDEDELRPGVAWQELLEQGIRSSRSVAVLVGKDGMGPWEVEEMHAALALAVKNKRPIIPVRLPGASKNIELPMFLGNRTWVKFERGFTDDAINKLLWGITGTKPKPTAPTPLPDTTLKLLPPNAISGRRLKCRLNCIEQFSEVIHARNATFIATLCRNFPKTIFRVFKENQPREQPIDPKDGLELMLGYFKHGDVVTLEVCGEFEAMAAIFFKIAWENLEGYSDDMPTVKNKITELIDQACANLYDQDLDELEERVSLISRMGSTKVEVEQRFIAVINDRLHDVSLLVIPLIAKHYNCRLEICFEQADQGIFSFEMTPENNYEYDKRILELNIEVGTRITILTTGPNAEEAGKSVKNVLQSLWQCDQWLRRRRKDLNTTAFIPELVSYAREMAKHPVADYGYVKNPFISNLLTPKHVVVSLSDAVVSKQSALTELSAPHAELHGLQISEIVSAVLEAERRLTVVPRPGFAIAHAPIEYGPRISISFGVYPKGIEWSEYDGTVYLIAMVIYAPDTIKTWRDYLKRFAHLFRTRPNLQQELVAATTREEFVSLLRNAEISMVKV